MADEFKELTRTCSVDQKGVRTYTRTFQVRMDDADGDPLDVAGVVGIGLYVAYPTDSIAYVRSIKATQEQHSPHWWSVEYEYSNAPLEQGSSGSTGGGPSGSPGSGNATVSPEARVWNVSMDAVEVAEPLLRDLLTSEVVAASNGQPFDPPVTVPTYRPQITFEGYKTLASDNYGRAATYVGCVNDAVWLTFAAQTVLCKKYQLQSQYEHGAYYWKKTVVVEIKWNGWNPICVMDAGTYERKINSSDESVRYVPILDAGQPVNAPVPLDGDGKRLARITSAGFNEVQYRCYTGYPICTFSGIL